MMDEKERILIVDDDESTRRSLTLIFENKGYETETARTGQEAMEKAQKRFFNLAILDIKLPDTKGIKLVAPLKKMHPDMVVVMATAYATLETAMQALNEGASAYITKPLSMDEVLTTVRGALERQGLVEEKQRAEETLRQRNRELALLNRVSQTLSSTLDLDQVLLTVLEEVRHLLDVIVCSVWLTDPDTDELVCRQATGPKGEAVRGLRLAPGEGIAGWVARHGRSLIVPDTRTEERYCKEVERQTGLVLRSVLTVPLQIRQGVIGVLQVVDTEVDRFGPTDLTLLESLAAAAAIAVENARLYEETDKLRAFHENIVQSMEEGILLEDATGRITFANPKAAELLGYTPGELMGQHCTDIVAPEEVAKFEEETAKRLQGIAGQYETVLLTKGGWRIPVIVSARPLFGTDQFIGVLSVFTDITERKRAEEQLQQYAAELERSNQELEEFAYVASHDLQEPLRMVGSYVQLLARRYKGKLDTEADEFIAYATDGVTRMQEMINGLLEYARVSTRGKRFEPTDCEAIFDRTLINLQVAIEESNTVVTHTPLPTVMADATQMGQLLQNLISNGIKFHDKEPPRIHVSARQEGNEWVFSVCDNGIGIDPQHADRIFLIFQRLHTRAEYPGTGMGLAICKKIVERHRGRIWAESQPGKDSTFYFTIPTKQMRPAR